MKARSLLVTGWELTSYLRVKLKQALSKKL